MLQAFYDMYRFSSECSELSELHILLWAGFPNPQLCQKCSIFRSYKCLCVTLYKIWNLIFCIRVWGFFPVTARLSKEICSTGWIRVNSHSLFLPLPLQRFLAILAQNQAAFAYFLCSSLIPGKIKESNGVSKSNKQKNSFMPFVIKLWKSQLCTTSCRKQNSFERKNLGKF